MNEVVSALLAAESPQSLGKWVFVAALAFLLDWLIVMPRHLIGQAEGAPPWWRNIRVWAIVVCTIQMFIYACFA